LRADAILTKPIEPRELYEVMGGLLADPRSLSTQD
jgi:hypothetical protein